MKDSPACLIAASDSQKKPCFVILLPTAHAPPHGDTIGIEIPATVKQVIGLDDARSWVIVSWTDNIGESAEGRTVTDPGQAGPVRIWLHPDRPVRADQNQVP